MKISKQIVLSWLTPLFLCGLLMCFDQLSQNTPSILSLGGWVGVVLRGSGYGFILAAVMFVLGRLAKWIFAPLFLLLLFVVFVEFLIRLLFGWNFFGDWLLLVQATSLDEVKMFFTENAFPVCWALLAFVLVVIFYMWSLFKWVSPNSIRARILIVPFLFVPFFLFDFRWHAPVKSFNSSICYRVITDTVAYATIYSEMGNVVVNPELPSSVQTAVGHDELPICVFVIGESMTRNNMHIYGYERDTTPCLDAVKDELCIFSDVLGVWNQTPMAVRYLFTAATYEDQKHSRYTLAQVAKRAGYVTSFYSVQGHWGALNNMVTYCFADCDKKLFLEDERVKPFYDMDLLPYFERQLSYLGTSPQVIFLHLYGCHYPCYCFTPDEEKIFNGGKKTLDDYDATVRHDDRLFGGIIRHLRELKRPAVMFYVSDHGETPRSSMWRDMDSSDMWEMPVVIWFSSEYREKFPETVARVSAAKDLELQNDLLLPAMMDVIQVKDNNIPVTVCPRKRRFTHLWQKEYVR